MTTLQAIALGIMVWLTPSMTVLALLLRSGGRAGAACPAHRSVVVRDRR
jgi:hypothetical protein